MCARFARGPEWKLLVLARSASDSCQIRFKPGSLLVAAVSKQVAVNVGHLCFVETDGIIRLLEASRVL
jgi:hypothetical protein